MTTDTFSGTNFQERLRDRQRKIDTDGKVTAPVDEETEAANIRRETVTALIVENWHHFRYGWASVAECARFFALDGNEGEFETELAAAARTRPHEQDRNTDTTNRVGATYAAIGEIRRLAKQGHTVEEIQQLTIETAHKVSGDPSPWSESSIERIISANPPPRRKLYGDTKGGGR